MPYLDIISVQLKINLKFLYLHIKCQGEYSLIKNGIKKIINKNAIIESLISFKRAGANAIVTYFANEIANKLD